MSYYRLLGLKKEPFSTSPDPSFFYEAPGHQSALYRLGVAVRLRRGLSLLVGDVGTGKTTLSRRLYQILSPYPSISLHVILNPAYSTELEFLNALIESFHMAESGTSLPTTSQCLRRIETELFRRATERNLTTTLFIDEAQKLSDASLEILRILLNYETHEHKLLQVVLFSQEELLPRIQNTRNLWDRIGTRHRLAPLDQEQTRAMICFRIQAAGCCRRRPLFTEDAVDEIHRQTQGYPRRISMMAHDALEHLVMYDCDQVDLEIISKLAGRQAVAIPAGVAA
ncbi:MAG: ExeA family protein [Candidatus Omnitrophica bacterium]|nr:ExeA family protein [Candidatus Omnitrophota bacterium]